MKLLHLGLALWTSLASTAALAAGSVKIGAIFPLTGNAASAGSSAKDAVELAVELVNAPHPELSGLPLANTAGLPKLFSFSCGTWADTSDELAL